MTKSRRRKGLTALVVMAAGGLSGCSSLGGESAKAGASTFCVKAEQLAPLDRAAQVAAEGDPATARAAWNSLLTGAKGLQQEAPGSLSGDYAVYLTWLTSLQDSLGRHDYKLGDALADSQFTDLTNTEKVAAARQSVSSYLDSTCHLSAADTGTTESTTSQPPSSTTAATAPSK